MNWKQYQNETADFFRSLGCIVEVESTIKGARAEHEIDVWVRFSRFGLETKWVVECKYWNTAIPKEKVLTLKSVVEDLGADRGILISASGFQSGAVRVAENSNITLTSLDELKETAREDLVSSVLHRIETEAIELKYALHNLFITEKNGPNSMTSKPLPGVNGKAVIRVIGELVLLDFGFDRVKLRKPPYPIKFDESGQREIVADTLDEFVSGAAQVISGARATLASQHPEDGT